MAVPGRLTADLAPGRLAPGLCAGGSGPAGRNGSPVRRYIHPLPSRGITHSISDADALAPAQPSAGDRHHNADTLAHAHTPAGAAAYCLVSHRWG